MSREFNDILAKWVESYCNENGLFLVDVESSANQIAFYIDSLDNITIEQCAEVSRKLHKAMENQEEELGKLNIMVSSPGMSNPLKHPKQFEKRLGKSIEVILEDGQKIEGKLIQNSDDELTIEEEKTIKLNGKKAIENIQHNINKSAIKKTLIPIKINKK